MKYTKELKNTVRELRAAGFTFSEIQERISVTIPKSTLSNWCSGVEMPLWYKEKVEQLNNKNFNKAQQFAWVSNRLKRERLLIKIRAQNSSLSIKLKDKDVLRTLLAILYLGEGTKWKSHSGLVLGSSDPQIILIYIRLLNICYGITPEQLKCRISYRADQDISLLEAYWSHITLIPHRNFYKTKPDPRTIDKPTKNRDYKGVCVIMGGSSAIQIELEEIPKIILAGL